MQPKLDSAAASRASRALGKAGEDLDRANMRAGQDALNEVMTAIAEAHVAITWLDRAQANLAMQLERA